MRPLPDGRAWRVSILSLCFISQLFFGAADSMAQKVKKNPGKKKAYASATPTPGPGAQVPLPIGHEAKGLIFPDIDENGILRGRFNAGTARRVDENHMDFQDLKITTFTEQQQPDLLVEMSKSTLDLETRILSSPTPTRIKRADFEVAGDRADFDTARRQGTLSGHVKMIITDAQKYSKPSPTPSSTAQP